MKIGITHGDINGISYEMLLKLLQDVELLDLCTPIIFGSAKVAEFTARHLNLTPVKFNVIDSPSKALAGHVNLVPVCGEKEPVVQFGVQTEEALKAEAESLMAAVRAYSANEIDCLITMPGHLDNDEEQHALSDFITKALQVDTPHFDWFFSGEVRMLQMHPVDVSSEMARGLASEQFRDDVSAISSHLRRAFGDLRPRLLVVSNEQKLASDTEQLREEMGIMVFGPMMVRDFKPKMANNYDGVLFLGADEPIRTLIRESKCPMVGYVSGLPLVLAYPLAGIGYEIAGKNEANADSLREAIYVAMDITRCRKSYDNASQKPLEKYWVPRGRDDFKLDLTGES